MVVTDETDKVLLSRRCPNELAKILALLVSHRTGLGGVVESTYNWYWLVDGLMAEGSAFNPSQVPQEKAHETFGRENCRSHSRKQWNRALD
jgi:predicted esterase YcpF (UPF0227 family)